MKKALLFMLVLFVAFSTLSYGQAPPKSLKNYAAYHRIESNYLKGLNSDNPDLRVSCAYFLGEMKSDKALIPLMKMFHQEKNAGVKMVAAWSLLKIGDARGVNLVKRSIELGECGEEGCMLRYLYMNYCLKTDGKIDKS